ncbi:MAG: D-2-hydroxyacid dehydrogenase [Gammaproteobacteria bacterium]|nr:D-2-hydroxyacid dehydrogenase [Gammaproteobacteria bacterium]MBU1478763.1 D-2-hydroxyacid dehydrogenase [Gammaproteobacteria bacterium]MBU2003333.1 D-2-hydroxyacid dehydrogenase [Gammaproteobacteria bacterium]MBU2132785.1 D-2-hydroxyacid dehydrogenase [Gammaproteobacteria bacterium]MBU2188887.1 D-2-hydroxyacid dehydrogenase [Gammaproteobacteria bacterium]
MGHKLLLLTKANQQYRDLIKAQSLPDLEILDDNPAGIIEADIWLAEPKLAAPLLPHAKNLQWLQSSFAGIDALISPRGRKDYQLTNIKGIFGPLMSEFVFGYLLAHIRGHGFYRQQQQQKQWLIQPQHRHSSLQGMRLLLLGTGSIAQHLAKTAKHFGMHVTGINSSGNAVEGFDAIEVMANLGQTLMQADVVVNLLPSTPATQSLLNADTLGKLKDDAVLFNVGRGDALDLDALNVQLIAKPAQQAVLDVFTQEPLPNSHPIWEQENAIITPHISAPSHPAQIVEIFSQNYHRYISGEPLQNRIDFSKGY